MQEVHHEVVLFGLVTSRVSGENHRGIHVREMVHDAIRHVGAIYDRATRVGAKHPVEVIVYEVVSGHVVALLVGIRGAMHHVVEILGAEGCIAKGHVLVVTDHQIGGLGHLSRRHQEVSGLAAVHVVEIPVVVGTYGLACDRVNRDLRNLSAVHGTDQGDRGQVIGLEESGHDRQEVPKRHAQVAGKYWLAFRLAHVLLLHADARP